MEQFDQLLTCAICLDRYRNPKLLPCQHSFCMEPCMEGLVDYVRRQVKCPECRAEHRIPYQGVQGFPTNVTLQRFLELHVQITGELPDPTSGQIMERCNVCSEKAYLNPCAHCEKKICEDCKEAHMDILRREISRINNQVRRGIHRLQDSLSVVEKNSLQLQQNGSSVLEEVDEIYRRLSKALKDRSTFLRGEIERYLATELRNLNTLKENLDLEISNIQSNCDLADKHMTDSINWDDCELMDTKEIFLKTMEFLRSFEYEQGDYNRRVRFAMIQDPNQLVLNLASYGELTMNNPQQQMLQPPPGPGLMRSKSDHRLATQFRQQEERGGYYGGDSEVSGRVSPLGGRKFGERYPARDTRYGGDSRYGRSDYGGNDYDTYAEPENRRPKFRSRFARNLDNDSDNEPQGRTVRFSDPQEKKERERPLDTEDVAKGPLSGITRLSDCPRVMLRLQEGETDKKKKEKEIAKPTPTVQKPLAVTPQTALRKTQRQVSEDDEISKIKKQNKSDADTAVKPATERVSALKKDDQPKTPSADTPKGRRTSSSQSEEDSRTKTPFSRSTSTTAETRAATTTVPPPQPEAPSSSAESDEGVPATTAVTTTTTTPRRKTDSTSTTPTTTTPKKVTRTTSASSETREEKEKERSRPRSPAKVSTERLKTRDASSDSSTSESSSASSPPRTGAAFSTDEVKQKILSTVKEAPSVKTSDKESSGSSTPARRFSSASSTGGDKKETTAEPASKTTTPTTTPTTTTRAPGTRFQSRFLNRAATPTAVEPPKESESSTESEETSSEEESEDETPVKEKPATTTSRLSSVTPSTGTEREVEKSDIGPLLARSANARETTGYGGSTSTGYKSRYGTTAGTGTSSPYSSDRDSGGYSSRYGTSTTRDTDYTPSSALTRSRTGASLYGNKDDTGSGTESRYPLSSKYLNRSRVSHDDDSSTPSRYGSYTSRFLNKSKSSAAIAPDDDGETSPISSRHTSEDDRYPSGRSRLAALKERRSRLARSRSSHSFGLNDDEDPDTTKDTAPTSPTSSYHPSRYTGSTTSADLSRSRSTHALKSRENSPERPSPGVGSTTGTSNSESLSSWARYLKNKYGSRNRDKDGGTTGTPSSTSATSSGVGTARGRSLSLGLPLRNAGSVDSSDDDNQKNTPTSPTSPTGFGSITRNQYLQKRRQLFKIGSRGSEPGLFTWPRGVAVGPDNSIVVADSSNHRVQVFDQNGIFVKEFGQYGNAEGEFDCLAGVAVNRIGQFIIADRYNHRIQVFDPSGRFLRAFGSQGTADGRFNYPWGLTTDALGFIYVCDKENHRIQVFQSDGTFVGKFGTMGNKPGQLEHPHYIAVSNTNRVIVSDSNNHRIQIFDVNGRVLTTFGSEGSEEGQFKFPRGVAVDDQGYIFVGDSGNNRIQIFLPDGAFLRAFGSWGCGDGEFKGLEGVAVMQNSNVLVCDRENHRVQVF